MIEVVESVARVIGTEVRFEERRTVRTRKRSGGGSSRRVLLLSSLGHEGTGARQRRFPTLPELEKLLREAPDLQLIRLEIEKLRLANQLDEARQLPHQLLAALRVLRPGPFRPDRKISGDTFVLGVSASISLDELLHRRKNRELELRLKQLEYRASVPGEAGGAACPVRKPGEAR